MPRIDMNDIYSEGEPTGGNGTGFIILVIALVIYGLICWISDLSSEQKKGLLEFLIRLLFAIFFLGLYVLYYFNN